MDDYTYELYTHVYVFMHVFICLCMHICIDIDSYLSVCLNGIDIYGSRNFEQSLYRRKMGDLSATQSKLDFTNLCFK